MNTDQNIEKLIQKRFNRNISSKEEEILHQWISESGENLKLYKKMLKHHVYLRDSHLIDQINERKAWSYIDSNITSSRKAKIRYLNIIRYAAAILLPLIMVGAIYYYTMKDDEYKEAFAYIETIQPGTDKAILNLSNGEEIMLENKKADRILFESKNIRIKDSSNMIVYKSKASISSLEQRDRIHVPIGGKYMAKLSDGTKVWLNSDTDFEFAINFTGSNRLVKLSGEAYFEVAEHKSKPFIVRTNGVDITVLGTSFNVSAYKNEKITTTLLEGKVKVSSAIEQEFMEPGDQIDYYQNKLTKKKVDAKSFAEWKDGIFRFKDIRLQDLTKKLSRWYNIDFFFDNDQLKELRFNGKVDKSKPLSEILNILKETNHITYKKSENAILIKQSKK